MIFNIEIINVKSSTKPTAKGSYTMLEVAFTNLSTGKVEGKKVMSFTNKEIYATLSKSSGGQVFQVTSEKLPGKDGQEYWTWTKVEPADGAEAPTAAPASPKAGFVSPKSTYETPEERAIKQVLIVRQSSLNNAIALLANEKKPPTVEDVLRTADIFANWVYQKNVKLDEAETGFDDMEDDLPM